MGRKTAKTKDVNEKSAETAVKADKSSASDTKSTVIMCAAIFLSVLVAASSLSKCMRKISEANKMITESLGGSFSEIDKIQVEDNDLFSEAFSDEDEQQQSDIPSDEGASDTAAVSDKGTPSQAEKSDSKTSSPSDKSNPEKKSAESGKPSTKEEIVEYFNTSINKVKPGAKSITIVNDESYQAGGIDLDALGAFEGIVDSLINSFMGANKEKKGLTITSAADKQKYFPVENESWASKLTAADVKEAKCAEKDGIYTIGIKVLDDDLSDNPTNGSNHHTRAFSVVKAGDINQNAGAARSLLSGLKTGYKNGTIICKIDAKTGNVISVSYDYVWVLHVDSFGGVNAPFGGRQTFDIKW